MKSTGSQKLTLNLSIINLSVCFFQEESEKKLKNVFRDVAKTDRKKDGGGDTATKRKMSALEEIMAYEKSRKLENFYKKNYAFQMLLRE